MVKVEKLKDKVVVTVRLDPKDVEEANKLLRVRGWTGK